MTTHHYVQIIEYGTERIQSEIGPYFSEGQAERGDNGVNRNLNHEKFYTKIIEREVEVHDPETAREFPGEDNR